MINDRQFSILESLIGAELRETINNEEKMPQSELESSFFYTDHRENLEKIKGEIAKMKSVYREIKWIRIENQEENNLFERENDRIWIKQISDNSISILAEYDETSYLEFLYCGNYILEWKDAKT